MLQLPGDIKLNYFDKESNMQEISIEELTKGKKASPLVSEMRPASVYPSSFI